MINLKVCSLLVAVSSSLTIHIFRIWCSSCAQRQILTSMFSHGPCVYVHHEQLYILWRREKKGGHKYTIRAASRRRSSRSVRPSSNPSLWSTLLESAFSPFPCYSGSKRERNHLEGHSIKKVFIVIILMTVDDNLIHVW